MLPPLPAFVQFLPSVEHASYVGTGAGGGAHVVAFRASRTRPLVVLVEMPLPAVLKRWTQDTWRLAAVAAVVATVLLLLTAVAARGQRGRRQAQAEVAAREREMSAIVGSVQELIFRTDAVGRLIFMNPHWQAVSPLPLDQALRRPLDELVHAESRDAVRALFALDGTTDGALKTRGAQVQIGPADAPRQFDVRVAPLHDGRFVTGFAGSAVDVTDRLADQARLRDQLAFNELMFEMLPLPVSMLDTKGRYLMVNRAWEDFTGRAATTCWACRRAACCRRKKPRCTTRRTAAAGPGRQPALRRHAAHARRQPARPVSPRPWCRGPDGRRRGCWWPSWT
jgi:PAS domain-containing protein